MPTNSRPSEGFERQLTRVLEAAPSVSIPPGFAVRVASAAVAHTPLPAHTTRSIGRIFTYCAFAVLLLMMILTARPHTLLLEFSFTVEFILLTLWLAVRPYFSS